MHSDSLQSCTENWYITENPFGIDHEIVPCGNPGCPAKNWIQIGNQTNFIIGDNHAAVDV